MSETLNQQQDIFSTNSNYALFVGKNFKYYSSKWYKFLSKGGLQEMRKQRFGDISFNFWAFFFNSIWCFYRKMYLKGILFMIGVAILGGINPVITLLACLILGIYANKVYFLHVDKKISKILSSNGNNEVARLEIIKTGGTSGFGAFIGLIVMSLFISIALLASNEEFKNAFAETPKSNTSTGGSYTSGSIKQSVKEMLMAKYGMQFW